ncbi:unnamed protein product [Effrenium voratum]|nr:unnamed protein product [Effrenium voratum]
MGSSVGSCSEEKCRLVDCKPEKEIQVLEPAGAVFAATLTGLNEVDKDFLLFSGRGHLAAVRWLLTFGADPCARDSNGTTGLHAACRIGSLSLVRVFLENPSWRLLDAADAAGWTPLHVAAFMGRQSVAQVLVEAGAFGAVHSKTGQSPAELCTDLGTRKLLLRYTEDARPLAVPKLQLQRLSVALPATEFPGPLAGPPEAVESFETPRSIPRGNSEIRYEPFFIPRAAVFDDLERSETLLLLCERLSWRLFDQHAGRGLAFIVASGVTRDYPMDLIAFLRTRQFSPQQLGWFLSEDFSLAKILRMEFLNSVRLVDTGVISALCIALMGLQIPMDLQRLDRLMWSLAEVWWRQHVRAQRAGLLQSYACAGEYGGAALWSEVASMDDLHELFFSTVLLHWNLHAPVPRSQHLTLSAWVDMHRVGGRQIVSEDVLAPIYQAMAKKMLQPLQLIGAPGGLQSMSSSLCADLASLEGWASALGDGLDPEDVQMFASLEETIGILCEGTFSARNHLTPPIGRALQVIAPIVGPMPEKENAVWLSLCGPLLLLASGPSQCPFAFLQMRKVQLADVDPGRALFSLQSAELEARLNVILLLPDGRWHVSSMEKLVLQLREPSELKNWVLSFPQPGGPSSKGRLLPI